MECLWLLFVGFIVRCMVCVCVCVHVCVYECVCGLVCYVLEFSLLSRYEHSGFNFPVLTVLGSRFVLT